MDSPSSQHHPRRRRVRRRADFVRIRREGRRVRDAVLLISYLLRGDDGPARLGLAVSRRAGNAVARNRIKRVVREAFRSRPELFPPGVDIVVSPADAVAARQLRRVSDSLAHLARRIAERLAKEGRPPPAERAGP